MSTRQSWDYRTSGNRRDTAARVITPWVSSIKHGAASPVALSNLYQRRQLAGALGHAEAASRLEGAARRHGLQRRHSAFDSAEWTPSLRLQVGHGLEQPASIRMSRSLKNFPLRSQLHHAPGIHHGHAIGHLRNHGKIVRDEEHRQAKLAAQVGEQLENL